jgi:hypothetical protein
VLLGGIGVVISLNNLATYNLVKGLLEKRPFSETASEEE